MVATITPGSTRVVRTQRLWLGIVVLSLSSSIVARAQISSDSLLGLPSLRGDEVAPQTVSLGKTLFFDTRLSASGAVSCGSCHMPTLAFSDGRAHSRGHDGQLTTRNAPSLINATYLTTLFWDGRAPNLESQALAPLTNPVEHALLDEADLEKRVRSDPAYAQAFRASFNVEPNGIRATHIARALAAYERTLRAGGSRFDRYQYGGDAGALNASAVRGLELFRGRAQCASCHTIGPTAALLTDESFHVTPLGLPGKLTANLGELTRKALQARRDPSGRAVERLLATDLDVAALGRFNVTRDPRDIAAFKTPSLRNVSITAPYMHDGSIDTLEKAVDLELYGRGTGLRYPIVLTASEKADLVEFLRSLTSARLEFP
jgi:cytochrome c peroxidase